MDALLSELNQLIERQKNIIKIYHKRNDIDIVYIKSRWDDFSSRWESVMNTKTKNEIKDIMLNNLVLLHQVHAFLVGSEIKFYHKHLIPNFRPAHDTIFNSMGIKRPYVKFKQIPTPIFTEFIKGITYFKTDIDARMERPVYHRIKSCGSKSMTIKEKFGITGYYSVDKALSKKEAIKKCYIERVIYDKIFQWILHQQDVSHLRELREMKILYEYMFPKSELTIEVRDYIGIQPMVLYIKDSKTESEEIYEKSQDTPVIRCSLSHNGKYFHKYQTFEKEESWIPGKLPSEPISKSVARILLRPQTW